MDKKNNHAVSRKRRRGHGLCGLVFFSVCVNSSNGFVNLMHPSRQYHQSQLESILKQPSNPSLVVSSAPSYLEAGKYDVDFDQADRRTTTARLTPEEETELLRRAVEYRRLNQLEKDLALTHQNSLPLLSVRAKHAGYGEDLDGYEEAKHEGQLARETLVTHNMGLVRYCVSQIIGHEYKSNTKNKNQHFSRNKGLPLNSLSREDLIQEGAIGLARAVDKWNPEIGGKFSTYAVYWVRAAVLRCIAERDDVVRVPNHVSQAMLQINKAAKRLGWVLEESGGILVTEQAIGGSSSVWKAANAAKRLAEEAGLSERRFEEAMKARRRRYTGGYVPFEPWMQKTGKSSSIMNQKHQSDENADYGKERLETSIANEGIRNILSKHLRPKEMEALSWRYGLLREEGRGQQVVGESIRDRANRQFSEMEDQLFGPSAVAATASTAEAALKRTPAKAKAVKGNSGKSVTTVTTPVARGRFGEAMTFTEVGKKMQVSAEYTRRLCHKAINKLQQAAEDGKLEPALLF